jgi:hypothetical protein
LFDFGPKSAPWERKFTRDLMAPKRPISATLSSPSWPQPHRPKQKEAQRAGIAHAKANGDARVYKGRKPSYSRKQFEHAQAMLGKSASVGEVARALGLTRQTVYRIKDDPAAAEAALATWGI